MTYKNYVVNAKKLVGTQDGEVVVPTYDWALFLGAHFRKVLQMKSYHHFHFSSSSRGTITYKLHSDSDSESFIHLKDDWNPTPDELPPVIPPAGLSLARQWYLYNQIREFCREELKIWYVHCLHSFNKSNMKMHCLHLLANAHGKAPDSAKKKNHR